MSIQAESSNPFDQPDDLWGARLAALRTELNIRGLEGFIIPLTDEHMSEYVGDYARRLAWLTGFQGSAGTAVVLADRAAIFVDGRYTLQVREQVTPDHWEYVGVPRESLSGWLKAHAPSGARIGYDPWLHTIGWVEAMRGVLADKGGSLIRVDDNPVDRVWLDRPAPSVARVDVQDARLAGLDSRAKRLAIGDQLTEAGADTSVMTALDSIAWTFNVRGSDVSHTPVPLAFALVHADGTADLFVDPEKMDEQVKAHLGNSVRCHPKAEFSHALSALAGLKVAVDSERAPAAVFDALEAGGAHLIRLRDPAVLAKAIKNPVEQAGHRAAQLRDGAALSRFLFWIDGHAPKGQLTELAAADQLQAFRAETGQLRDLSFDTISAAGPNAASPHYKVTAQSNRQIEPNSVYLVDSGGQYPDGTTDVTRTIWIGPGSPPAEVTDRNTRVLKGHIAIATARFPEGTTGSQLDSFARQYLWSAGLDYGHGTGHGVGAYLSVHEGPQRIAKASGGQAGTEEALQAGMILSNEPGYYKPGAYGIRIENLVLVETREIEGAELPMLGFETLTFAPLDRRLIDPDRLTPEERQWVNDYHADVIDRIGPQLQGEERAWLEAACAPL